MRERTAKQAPSGDAALWRDENEQLRTALEMALEENARLIEDRDRLLGRVSALSRDLQRSHADYVAGVDQESALAAASTLQSQTDEELRVAFEELQALAEELEIANAGLHESNRLLDARVGERTRELYESNAALHATEISFRSLADLVPDLLWRTDSDGAATWFNRRWFDRTGQAEHAPLGRGWIDVVHEADRPAVRSSWAVAVRRGTQYQREVRIRDVAGAFRWYLVRATRVAEQDGLVGYWLVAGTDIHDIILLRKRQAVLVAELQHRTRNLMAVVQAVALRTLKSSDSLAQFRETIDDRFTALARVQGLLSRRAERRVAFDTLVRAELSAHVDLDDADIAARVQVTGPADLRLPASIVQTLALALHELATNAVKYGALSQPEGRLDIGWTASRTTADGQMLAIEWRERGVVLPAAAATRRSGYGRELIERALPYQLDARTDYAFTAEGVQCTIVVVVPDEDDQAETSDD